MGASVHCPASMTEEQVYYFCQLEPGHTGQHMAVIAAFKKEPERTLWWKWLHQSQGKRARWAEL